MTTRTIAALAQAVVAISSCDEHRADIRQA
jgi:hypothetical protein